MKPKYFDYLSMHGQYLTDRFGIRCEEESLEADIARYRRRETNEKRYWASGVYLRRLLEQIVDSYLASSTFEYGKQLGKKISEGADDGFIPQSLRDPMLSLNRLTREGAHYSDEPYTASDLEDALIQLDVIFRTILQAERKPISGMSVRYGTDSVLTASSDVIEEKAKQAAELVGDKRLIEESRAANRRAMTAEREALEARQKVEEAARENEQLRLQLEIAEHTIEEQKAAYSKKRAVYAKHMNGSSSMEPLMDKLSASADARAAQLESSREAANAKLVQAEKAFREKEAIATEAAVRVAEMEEYLDGILNERDFIAALLGKSGKATAEQRRIVNFPTSAEHKSRFVKVTGKAGTGKTLCLLAAVINYLEPNSQISLSYGDQSMDRSALFVCYNKDLARYITGLLERFPHLSGRIEVANYDQFLNQLVRTRPIKEFEHLSRYASDVRFQPIVDTEGARHYWNLLVDEGAKLDLMRQSIADVRAFYMNNGMQEYCSSPYLNDSDDANVTWMLEEIEWLEGRYHDIEEGRAAYPGVERVGRGNSGRRPAKFSVERTHVSNVWVAYYNLRRENHVYTLQQVVTTLLQSRLLPKYSIVAIDEAQDLNMLHVELFVRFMADGGYLLIAGDEGQRIYPRDFTWKAVDSKIKSITLPLNVNMRNPVEVRRFAGRVDGRGFTGKGDARDSSGVVQVLRESKEDTVARIKVLAGQRDETTAVVTSNVRTWERLLYSAGIETETSKDAGMGAETIRMCDGRVRPGVYCIAQLKTKGLEFDNVIIDYAHEVDKQDVQREKRIRYMQFTRARKTLLVRYEDEPPRLLQEYYPDYLALSGWKKR